MVKNVQNLRHNGKKCPETTARSKMATNYRMKVKNAHKLQHNGQNGQKLPNDGKKCPKTTA
jgi:hypothetical protein